MNRLLHKVTALGAGLAVCLACSSWRMGLSTAVFAQTSTSGATPETHPPTQGFPSPSSSHYDHRFGENPYLPSEARADFEGFLKPEDFPAAAYCSHCHADVHAQWRQSAHANSFRTPWYLKNIADLTETRGIAYTRHCEGCHNPVALFTGALTPGSTVARPGDADGVSCMVCHSISSVPSTRGIGSYVMGRPAVMTDAAGQPQSGLPSDADILAHLDRHKAAVTRPIYKTAEYCGACHKAAMPKILNGYKWLRTFSTFDEWQQSSWSTETPLSFYAKPARSTCQTCHMAPEQARDPVAKNGTVSSHRWVGANTAVPVQYGFDKQAQRVLEFLRADQMEIDIFGVTVEHSPGKVETAPGTNLIAPLNHSPATILPGDWVRFDVVVRNKGVGHTLVPELRDFYESWLRFDATDDSGRSIFSSGAVNKQNEVDPSARSYTLKIVGQNGLGLEHHEVWKTYVRAYDATILPGKSDVVRYRFQVPPTTQGFTVSASLLYRRFNRVFTNYVFGDSPDSADRFPTVTLASATIHVITGVNKASAPANAEVDALRWNNYGIGMLDRQQYAEAVHAFEQVIRLTPNYEPGYVNIAIAEYSRGRYPQALALLERAAKLNGADDRALYYKGLCLRWQGKFDDAIHVLMPVGERWPRFRQVHQELGYLLMQRKRLEEARAQYEAVLAIDPDDPTAHRWLGPVLSALGDKAGAVREAKLAADTGNDPAAGFVAQKFWREHPVIASEAMPAHTHSAENKNDDADLSRVLQLQNPPSYIWVEHY